MLRLSSDGWYLIGALVFLELAVIVLIVSLIALRRRNRSGGSSPGLVALPHSVDAAWAEREISRLRAGEPVDESLIKQLSPEDRAMFEVSMIDALNKASREDQHRLRSALVKCGYDEQCARRVMGADISDRVRASALLGLLRPYSKESSSDAVRSVTEDGADLAKAVRNTTGSLDPD
jgi:hypothetical protein